MRKFVYALVFIVVLSFTISAFMFNDEGFGIKLWWQDIFAKPSDNGTISNSSNSFTETIKASALEKVIVDVVSANCEIIINDGTDITIEYHGEGEFSAKNNNATLLLKEEFKGWPKKISSSGSLAISIPASTDIEMDLLSVSGNFTAKDIISSDLYVKTVSGRIVLSNCISEELELETTSGECDLTSCSFDEAKLNSVSGDIAMSIVNTWDSVKADSVSGSIKIFAPAGSKPSITYDSVSGKLYSDFGINTTNGSDQTIDIETVSGDIHIKESKSQ